MIQLKPSSRYTIQFRNGDLLRHQDALQLAQFRSDARLLQFWVEADPPSSQTSRMNH